MYIICQCGKKVKVKPSRVKRTKYCSKTCFYKYRKRRSGLKYKIKKLNKGWFKKGDKRNVGRKVSEKTKNKISLAHKNKHHSVKTEFKKGQVTWNKGKKFLQITNEKHSLWKGDDVGKPALHRWIEGKLGKKKKCEKCGTTKSKVYHWHNISGKYTRDFNDWMRLCSHCHALIHKNWEKRWKKNLA